MTDWLTMALLLVGALFMLLAGIGVVRLPDVYVRMQAVTKASTLGVICMMAATAGHFGTAEVLVRAFLVVALLFMTTPIAAHVLAQAAYRVGTPLWKGTRPNELEDRYDELSGRVLGSPPPNDAVPPDEVQERRSR